jgi:putative transcriptional regulator
MAEEEPHRMSNAGITKKTVRAAKSDWKRFDAMTAKERQAAAVADRDSRPLTPEDFKRMKRTPRAKIIRRALGLTQQEFAARFRIPVGTLRDWEQGAAEPDQAARSYLTVIARNPEAVAKALQPTD